MNKRICIVTPRHISYNPRVVKEADALTGAGHDVTVIAVNNHPAQRLEDERVMSSREWRLVTVEYRLAGIRESSRWLWTGCRKRIYQRTLSRLTLHYGFAERAQGREHVELSRLACSQPADLYIAHHVEALGAACSAARRHRARFAFDSEDFHSGELPEDNERLLRAKIEYLEAKYLPQCDYITASSEDIADALVNKYGIRPPEVILNVFPFERVMNRCAERRDIVGNGVSLYWYSQVIGPGRGLEEAIKALEILRRPVQLNLRGTPMNGFADNLRDLAESAGLQDRILFHPPAPADDLICLAAEHDIGLCIEPGKDLNNLLASSNKLFSYMAAGLAIVATDTPGQQRIMDRVPDVGIVCRRADPASLAYALESLISDPIRLTSAKRASWRAAKHCFNWESEKKKFVNIVENCLA
jgi:glycosyltransferase involved in cell wall biosynthesis